MLCGSSGGPRGCHPRSCRDPVLWPHLLPSLPDPGGRQFATDDVLGIGKAVGRPVASLLSGQPDPVESLEEVLFNPVNCFYRVRTQPRKPPNDQTKSCQITKCQYSQLGKASFLTLNNLGKASYSRDPFAKLPNRIPPTVESKIGQLSNQNLIEILDIQIKNQ